MFNKCAAVAHALSEESKNNKYIFRYQLVAKSTKSVVVEASDHDQAKRKFMTNFPTATILGIAQV